MLVKIQVEITVRFSESKDKKSLYPDGTLVLLSLVSRGEYWWSGAYGTPLVSSPAQTHKIKCNWCTNVRLDLQQVPSF